jgi:hypothetical protein
MKRKIFVFLSGFISAALGISPARDEVNFVSGLEFEKDYKVFSDNPDQKIELYTEGDLAEYAIVSKDLIVGSDSFKVRFKFPEEIEIPGVHRILVGAKEELPEDVFVGSSVNIRAVMYVHVPFPGKYIESKFQVPNVNLGEKVPIEVYVINRGKESLNFVDVLVNIYENSTGEKVDSIEFSDVSLTTGQETYFRKYWINDQVKAGDYYAEAVINYDSEVKVLRDSFRLGDLSLRVINYTKKLEQGGIQRFDIWVESLWNDPMSGVYSDVEISDIYINESLRTPSIDILPWKEGRLTGYLDTTHMEGDYDLGISLFYLGETSFTQGFLTVYRRLRVYYMVLWSLFGLFFLSLVVIIVLLYFRLRKEKRGKK